MGIHDRLYARQSTADARRARWRAVWPPPATLSLMIAHTVAFAALLVIRHDDGAQTVELLALRGASSHPLALLTHPVATTQTVAFVVTLLALWAIGTPLERISGPRLIWLLYGGGGIVAGVAYFGFAQVAAEMATFPLDVPAGGLGAWVVTLRSRAPGATVLTCARRLDVVRVVTIGVGLMAVAVFAWAGPPATGWLLATGAGCGLGWVLGRAEVGV